MNKALLVPIHSESMRANAERKVIGASQPRMNSPKACGGMMRSKTSVAQPARKTLYAETRVSRAS